MCWCGSHGLRPADALIGATAIEHKATLITANVKHFSTVDGLAIEALTPPEGDSRSQKGSVPVSRKPEVAAC